MIQTMSDTVYPGRHYASADFPSAPEGWTPDVAKSVARREGLTLNEQHFEVIRALQTYFAEHDQPTIKGRELHDALDEKFHVLGGLRFLYELLPGGPVAQGCRLAGIEPPAGSEDSSFGSVM